MAEPTTITLTDDGGVSSPVTEGVDVSGNTTPLPAGTQAPEARIAELERLLGRHREQLSGWDTHSRNQQAELNATRERLARLEGRSEGTQPSTKGDESVFTPGKMKSAMTKWLNNDDTEIDALEQALGRSFAQPGQAQLKPEDFKKLIREELVELGTKGNVQTIVGTRHPDLADARSQLTQTVWEEYDAYIANPENVVLYGKDERYHVPMLGPNGQQRMVDARYVDRLAADIKLREGIREGRQQESRASQVGGTQTGSGRTTQTNMQRSVEAIDLLSDTERQLIQDPKVRKGWPKMPADPKAAAKYFWEGLLESDKARRLAEHRDRLRGRG